MKPEVRIFADPDAWVEAAAELFRRSAREASAARRVFTVALAGGKTPLPLYERLGRPPYRRGIDWGSVQLFWGDERCVPAENRESNYGLARRSLIEGSQVPPANIHPVPVTADGCSRSARAYEEELYRFFSPSAAAGRPPIQASEGAVFPRFDLIILGLGPDGHTASLFPGHPALEEKGHWVVPVPESPLPPHVPRVTLTLPVINRARIVLFLVSGPQKLELSSKILNAFGKAGSESPYPAARVRPEGKLIWMILK